MKQKVDAIILAGTKNCDQFHIGEKRDHKQYLELDGKFVLEYVIDAALCTKSVRRIFIICDIVRIKQVLKKYTEKEKKRIQIVQNQNSLMASLLHCFINYTKRAILLPSDAPFLTARDIDDFLAVIQDKTEYGIGFSNGEMIDSLFENLALYIQKEKIKYGLFPIYGKQVRISNLHYLDFSHIKKEEFDFVQKVFDNRKLLDQHGRKNRKNWKNIFVAGIGYLHHRMYNPSVLLGAGLMLIYGVLFYAAHKARFSKIGKCYAYPLRPNVIEYILWLLSGCQVHCQVIVTENITPMLDIDVPETYLLLSKNNAQIFKEMRSALEEQ